jgi:hypothetical protein
MHTPQEDAAKVIMTCIQNLERYSKHEEIPINEFDEFKKCLTSAVEWTYDLIHSEELEIAMQLLDLLESLENVICRFIVEI